MTGATADSVDLAEVLAGSGALLDQVAAMARRIDEGVGAMVQQGRPQDSPPCDALQEVDRLRQLAECLHRLMENAAHEAPSGLAVPVARLLDGVYLSEVREACLVCAADPVARDKAARALDAQGAAKGAVVMW